MTKYLTLAMSMGVVSYETPFFSVPSGSRIVISTLGFWARRSFCLAAMASNLEALSFRKAGLACFSCCCRRRRCGFVANPEDGAAPERAQQQHRR